MITQRNTRKAWKRLHFCNANCRGAYRADRQHGLIYAHWKIEGAILSHEDACKQLHRCPYCGADL